MTWAYDAEKLATTLEDAGFDVDRSQATLAGGGGSLTARRDRGAATWVVTIDAGGRLKAVLTRLADESPSDSLDIAGQSLRVVTEVTRTMTATGQLSKADQLEAILVELEKRLRSAGEGGASPESPLRPWWRKWW